MVRTFKSVDETFVCDHSNESYRAVLLVLYYLFGFARLFHARNQTDTLFLLRN